MDLRTRYMMSVIVLSLVGAMIMSASSVSAVESLEFTFFLHDNFRTATNTSAFAIIEPLPFGLNTSGLGESDFGSVVVFDDSMTTGPDPTSLEIGRGRGFYVLDLNGNSPGLEFVWTAEFNAASGYGAGSTLTFKGFDRVQDPVREIAIVGGTGTFRLARGWVVISTYSASPDGFAANINMTATVYYGL